MTPTDVYKFYGSMYKFNRETGMSSGTLHNWLKWGYVPIESQRFIERNSGGKLKLNWDHTKK